MLEEKPKSLRPTKRINLAPYHVDEEFQGLSYAKRYEIVCQRMVREMLYDAACFLTSNTSDGLRGKFSQPNPELSIKNFAISLHARAAAIAKIK
jgi:type II restriction enzyme